MARDKSLLFAGQFVALLSVPGVGVHGSLTFLPDISAEAHVAQASLDRPAQCFSILRHE